VYLTILDSTVAIREQNGAYGVYAGLDHWIGSLYLVRYHDPLLATTLSAYDAAEDALYADRRDGVVTPEVVTMAIIGVIASIDGVGAAAGDDWWKSNTCPEVDYGMTKSRSRSRSSV